MHLNSVQKRADTFIENHTIDFLNDSELLRYDYNPRGKFTYENDTKNTYRVFPIKNEVRLICISDTCTLSDSFTKTPLVLLKGRYILKQDSIMTVWRYDSLTVDINSFEINPEVYFQSLENRIEKYGLLGFSKSKNKQFIRIYLSVQYYLIQSKNILQDIYNDQIVKSYHSNWYLIKMERPMDLG